MLRSIVQEILETKATVLSEHVGFVLAAPISVSTAFSVWIRNQSPGARNPTGLASGQPRHIWQITLGVLRQHRSFKVYRKPLLQGWLRAVCSRIGALFHPQVSMLISRAQSPTVVIEAHQNGNSTSSTLCSYCCVSGVSCTCRFSRQGSSAALTTMPGPFCSTKPACST